MLHFKIISEESFFGNTIIVSKTVQEILSKYQELRRPVIVGIDGQSGSGKSTLAKLLKEKLQKSGYKVFVDENNFVPSLDMFLKNRVWRYQKMQEVADKNEIYHDENYFFEWAKVNDFYEQITGFINSERGETTIQIFEGFNQETKQVQDYEFKLTREMIVLLEGKYLRQAITADLHYRLKNPSAQTYFMERSKVHTIQKRTLMEKFFHLALRPSYERYLERFPKTKNMVEIQLLE
jgi:deoxyadenosine/deoxycytidine kinase